MNRILTYILLSLSVFAISCRKAEEPSVDIGNDRDNIYFFMRDVNYGTPSSKTIIEDTETLKNLELPLKVVDQYAISSPFDGSVDMIWNGHLWPARNNRGNSVAWQGKDYLFYSFLSSGGTGSGAGTVSFSKIVKPADKVTITQPISYTHDDKVWADFLMSYIVPVDGRLKPLVEFNMERITAGVEVYVSTPLDPSEASITIKKISIDNISNKADYSLVHHDYSNSGMVGIRNNWVASVSGNYKYERNGNISVQQRTTQEVFDQTFIVMRFVTVPQPVNGKLTIEYRSNGIDYAHTFDLSQIPSVRRWERGRKARYYINIDTSAGLEANVAEWISVDYIEGTFLPWLPEDDDEQH